MTTIAIVVGHREKSQGTVSCDGVPEWCWNVPLAHAVADALRDQGYEAHVVTRPNFKSGNVTRLVNALNKLDPTAIVSLHHNGGPQDATGSETLCYPGSRVGMALADAVQRQVVACLGLADRGVKQTTHNFAKKPKKLRVLTDTNAPTIIVETHFAWNPDDRRVANANKDALAQAIANGIAAVV